jgi:hypothetical protein
MTKSDKSKTSNRIKQTIPLVALIAVALLVAGGFWWFGASQSSSSTKAKTQPSNISHTTAASTVSQDPLKQISEIQAELKNIEKLKDNERHVAIQDALNKIKQIQVSGTQVSETQVKQIQDIQNTLKNIDTELGQKQNSLSLGFWIAFLLCVGIGLLSLLLQIQNRSSLEELKEQFAEKASLEDKNAELQAKIDNLLSFKDKSTELQKTVDSLRSSNDDFYQIIVALQKVIFYIPHADPVRQKIITELKDILHEQVNKSNMGRVSQLLRWLSEEQQSPLRLPNQPSSSSGYQQKDSPNQPSSSSGYQQKDSPNQPSSSSGYQQKDSPSQPLRREIPPKELLQQTSKSIFDSGDNSLNSMRLDIKQILERDEELEGLKDALEAERLKYFKSNKIQLLGFYKSQEPTIQHWNKTARINLSEVQEAYLDLAKELRSRLETYGLKEIPITPGETRFAGTESSGHGQAKWVAVADENKQEIILNVVSPGLQFEAQDHTITIVQEAEVEVGYYDESANNVQGLQDDILDSGGR